MNFATAICLLLATGWPQFGRDPGHSGATTTPGQPLQTILADVLIDPFVASERALQGNELLVHYPVPLIDGNDVFIELKGGTFTEDWSTQVWSVQALRWQNSRLVARWTAASDWKPVSFTPGVGPRFEPVFHPVLANGSIYMPGAGGSVLRLNRDTGSVVERLGGSFPPDAVRFVSGPLVADSAGNIYYNVIALAGINPWTTDIREARLMRIDPSGVASSAPYSAIATAAPAPTAQCPGAFSDLDLPWPPSATAIPPSVTCGSQRPGVNVAPAIASDGTIYTVSRAHFNSRWSYLIAVNPDLTPKWSVSLRDRFNDGCNVLLPLNGTAGGCKEGAPTGVDPSDNTTGAGRATDDSSSSPLIAPDGSILYGAFTRYNYSQGHLMHFSNRGDYLGAYAFGWDITPAISPHGSTYSVVTKENRYPIGSYCDAPQFCSSVRRPNDPQGYFVTQLDASLHVEWRLPGSGDEWCVNGPAVDRDGVVYMNSEDGFLYAINPDGTLRKSILLASESGQAYTPLAIDDQGRVYAQNGGHLFVAGTLLRHRAVRPSS